MLGELADEDSERFERHYEVCRVCQQMLKESNAKDAREDSIVRALRHPDDDNSLLKDSAFLRLQAEVNDVYDHQRHATQPCRTKQQSVPPLQSEPMTQVGRFQIKGVLGSGTFGTVYLATDSDLQRKIALKIPHNYHLMMPDAKQRFVWEARAAARLDHPNLLGVFDAGEHEGIPFIASQYCGGPTLAEAIKNRAGVFPTEVSARLILNLSEAIHHAHSRGILHRDLKPSNILFESDSEGSFTWSDGAKYTPKIADFGLAKSFIPDEESLPYDATKTGMILGTPAYMSPEQLKGDNRNVDTRADVYALGMILYELLTGQRPFEEKFAFKVLELMDTSELTFSSQVSAGIPRDLKTICLKCLNYSPDQRYSSVGDLAEDLRHFLNHEPIRARPATLFEKTIRWIRRRPAAALLVLLSFLGSILATAGLALHNQKLAKALLRVERSESVSQNHLYAANIRLAHQAWESDHIQQYRGFLKKYRNDSALPDEARDPRGVEWYYLNSLDSMIEGEQAWRAHDGGVCCACYSPNGKILATSGTDGLIKLWDAGTAELIHTLRGHEGDVNKIAFSHDGLDLASAGDDSTVRLWHVGSGKLRSTSRGHQGRVFEVLFLYDDERIASAGDGDNIHFWFRKNGKLSRSVSANNVRGLAMHPRKPLLAVVETTKTLYVTEFGMNNFEKRIFSRDVFGHTAINDLALSHDGKRVLLSCGDGTLREFNAATGESLQMFKAHQSEVQAVQYSADDQWIVSTGSDDAIRLWDGKGRPLKVFRGHENEVWTLDFSPNNSLLATGDRTGNIRIWNYVKRIDSNSAERANSYLNVITDNLLPNCTPPFSLVPGNTSLVATCLDAAFQVIDQKSGDVLQRFGDATDAENIIGLATSPNGKFVTTYGNEGQLSLWNVAQHRLVRKIQAHADSIWNAAFSPDSRFLATCSEDKRTRLWDIHTGEQLADWKEHQKPVLTVAFSPDGQTLVSAGVDSTAVLFDMRTLTKRSVLREGRHAINSVVFSPAGNMIATAEHGRQITLWDVHSGQILHTMQGHTSRVLSLAFSADGKTLLSGDASGSLRFWQVQTGVELFDVRHSDPKIVQISVSEDGSFFVASQDEMEKNGTLSCWRVGVGYNDSGKP